jgi:PAS domain S-box-containing protein
LDGLASDLHRVFGFSDGSTQARTTVHPATTREGAGGGADLLRESEARLRESFERAPVGMAHVGLDGRWLRFNRRLAEIVGYPVDELARLTFQEITHPDDLAADLAHVARLLAGDADEFQMEKRYVRKDGSPVWVMLHAAMVRGDAGAPLYFISVVEDISERKAVEAERARLAAIVASSEDAILTKSLTDGRILSWNATAERMLGFTAAEAVGQPVTLIIPPEQLAEEEEILERLRRGERIAPYDTVRLRKDGSLVEVSLSVSPVYDEAGRPVIAAKILRDVTTRKRAEAELAAARHAAEAGSRAKSQFLAMMSHEIRTPLSAILGYVDLLELGLAGPLEERQRDYLERVRQSGRHLLAVINQVLDLAKIEADRLPVERVAASAGEAVAAALTSVEPQAATRALAVVNGCGLTGSPWFLGDPDRVQQILVNLLANAVKFTPPGGRVTVTCGTTRLPPREARVSADAAEWTYVRVEDTGVGIAQERLAAVFEPFEQAESGYVRRHDGTGLGLTISRRLARLMGGDITARSAPGVGSAFFLWLPATRAAAPLEGGAPRERRTAARLARGLGAVGDAALESLEHVVAAFVARLRADPGTPSAERCTDEQLEDHAVTFLADVAQCLALIEAARGAPSDLLRDGTAIQRVISERHGVQRARLGFAEDELRREYALLGEEAASALRRGVEGAEPEPAGALEQAIGLFARFIEHAERAALQGFREEVARG